MSLVCPHCGEGLTLRALFKPWLTLRAPHLVYTWLERRREVQELADLKRLYTEHTPLTEREHWVSSGRVQGYSYEQLASKMNVTKERVRQIQAKALRKLR